MTAFDPDELPPELDPAERAALTETAAVLLAARPVPRAGFRGALRRATLGSAARPPRPPWLRRRVAGLVAAGVVLILVAATGLTGHGPLAPPSAGATTAAPAPGR